jgi:hypothetical protein
MPSVMSTEDAIEALKLEETRFSGDGGDLALLHALRKAEQAIEVASSVSLREDQLSRLQISGVRAHSMQESLLEALPSIHALFLKLILPTPTPTLPKPGRPIRHLLTRCAISIHKKVESRSLFDFVQAVLQGIADGGGKNMGIPENVMRVAGWFVVGEVIKELGANVSSPGGCWLTE